MIIENNTKSPKYRKIKFGMLNLGEVFVDADNGGVYMRLATEVYKSNGTISYNAVDLQNGLVATYKFDEMVFRTDSILEYVLLQDKENKEKECIQTVKQ